MKVAVTGSTGLIGTALVDSLRDDGHEVVRLVRGERAAADEASWDPMAGTVDDAAISAADAVVNLAGAGIGDRRWTPAYKALVRDSRIRGTATIAAAVARHHTPVLIQASAVGWYGDRGDDVLTEAEPAGNDFLAILVRDWEAASQPASDAGTRVVHLRSGIVLSPTGGALKQMLPIFSLGLGGRLGSGRQWMPWVSLADEITAIRFAMNQVALTGAANVSSPNPVTNRELTAALGRVLRRPAIAAVPRLALRIGLGEFADVGLMASLRAVPTRLLDAGFTFADPDLEPALTAMLGSR